jgi:transketolase
MLNERSKFLRREIIKLSKANGGYHYGGTFSTVEILVCLYDKVLTAADKFILSKGHGCWGYYVLLKEKGFKPMLEGHPHLDIHNGVYFTTGSEGHGLPAGLGMAFARKKLKTPGKIFVLMGDGECQEGTTWESLLIGGFHKINNLVAIVDYNGIQGSGYTKDILPVDPVITTAAACGWQVTEIDGHDNEQLLKALTLATDKPHFIVARTVKGKGVDFMENKPEWHSKWPNPAEEQEILKQLQ